MNSPGGRGQPKWNPLFREVRPTYVAEPLDDKSQHKKATKLGKRLFRRNNEKMILFVNAFTYPNRSQADGPLNSRPAPSLPVEDGARSSSLGASCMDGHYVIGCRAAINPFLLEIS